MKALFSKNLSQQNKIWVIENYSGQEWLSFLKMFDNKKITNHSCILAKKIFLNTDIKVFPVIFSRKLCFLRKSQGLFSWIMYQDSISEIGCIDNVKDCLSSRVVFSQENRHDKSELYLI